MRCILFHVKFNEIASPIPMRWALITKDSLTVVYISYNLCHVAHSYVGEQNPGREIAATDNVEWDLHEFNGPLEYRNISSLLL